MAIENFNVASASSLPGRVDQFWERFEKAGFAVGQLPDVDGWMPTAPFSGSVVGRIDIRDELGRLVAAYTERDDPYTHQQGRNFMKEGRVLDRCTWPVSSIPAIRRTALEAIAQEVAALKQRRNRQALADPSSGSIILARD